MPVLTHIDSPDHHLFSGAENSRARVSLKSSKPSASCVTIGLINNMPDSALISTERQIFDLLNASAGRHLIRLRLYALPMVPRTDWGQRYIRRFYSGIDDLLDSDLDGIIVTGAEPQAPKLMEEPYWGALRQVIDWAQENTLSAIWSCLAVHSAILHLDGIDRLPLDEKCIGVFEQERWEEHGLIQRTPLRLKIPHSRWNEVHQRSLTSAGYRVLTKCEDSGVDMFIKQQKKSLFVYFQGHPEYDAHSLLGEYRRDVGRFLRREVECYPTMPKGYFDDQAVALLATFQGQALSNRCKELLATFPSDRVATNLRNTWRLAATRIYRNWISFIHESRAALLRPALTSGSANSH
jgi:homoserine O-succinyltransferase/O-acetyltransferase